MKCSEPFLLDGLIRETIRNPKPAWFIKGLGVSLWGSVSDRERNHGSARRGGFRVQDETYCKNETCKSLFSNGGFGFRMVSRNQAS